LASSDGNPDDSKLGRSSGTNVDASRAWFGLPLVTERSCERSDLVVRRRLAACSRARIVSPYVSRLTNTSLERDSEWMIVWIAFTSDDPSWACPLESVVGATPSGSTQATRSGIAPRSGSRLEGAM
jgi:hypothetical protein